MSPTDVHRDTRSAAAGPALTDPAANPADLDPNLAVIWRRMHAANQAAYRAGRDTAGHPALNPYAATTDEHYWWNEGRNYRPFTPLTTTNTLVAVAGSAGKDSTD